MRYSRLRRLRSRGIVLVLVLAVLALLALIGITFATLSGQARISARNYAISITRPLPDETMDFALAQLIGDTNDVGSVIRGHSMARDMFGNDSYNNGYLARRLENNGPLLFTGATFYNNPSNPADPRNGTIACVTNIQAGAAAYYGYNFSRWIVRFGPGFASLPGQPPGTGSYLVGQTFEVLADDNTGGVSTQRVLYLSAPAQPVGVRSGYSSPEAGPVDRATPPPTMTVQSQLIGESFADQELGVPGVPTGVPFVLDGRYLRAFNGPGLGSLALYGNFRYNGGLLSGNAGTTAPGDPNVVGMDEDYDACDLENWYLAIQSADGKVVIPSFHRPGILRYFSASNRTDWDIAGIPDSQARILRPRLIDGHDAATFPDLLPDPATGVIDYDVDNDGDGITDSVWLDLGYPAQRDSRGRIVKPLFAFLVLGLNGRIPLNTAGNLAMRAPDGTPLFLHTSHLGNSPSEIDPTFALQNATYFKNNGANNAYSQLDDAGILSSGVIVQDADGNPSFTPGDAAVSVNVTQLRNILTGTRAPSSRLLAPASGEANWVMIEGKPYYIPNNMPDLSDITAAGSSAINLPPNAVAGRWGEAAGIPASFNKLLPNYLSFANPVRAGLSIIASGIPHTVNDGRDDNLNAHDFWPSSNMAEAGGPSPVIQGRSGISWPADYYDAAGGLAMPVERIRRFLTPIDVSGDGQVVNWSTRDDTGADAFGRVAFRRYFRPAGVPVATTGFTDPVSNNSYQQGQASIPDLTNNPTHGYESFRNPNIPGTASELHYAAAPADLDQQGNPVLDAFGARTVIPGGSSIPTFDQFVNSLLPTDNLNETDEVNLYSATQVDQPFGFGDLEWLYRAPDADSSSLRSRLADLAPVSFTNPVDGLRRRRLFTVDVWETNRFAWANDNPGGRFSDNCHFACPSPAGYAEASAMGASLSTANAGLAGLFGQGVSLVSGSSSPGTFGFGIGPPLNSSGVALSQGDRRINLNYPLPVSNDPDEGTRLKWIAESYQLLKQVLPPLSLDTPEELAQLSQFLINVIDFRDPDATMTHWRNPDVVLVPGPSGLGACPYLAYTSTDPAGALPLDQYGMEYNPVALNEILAFSYRFSTAGKDTGLGQNNRFFIELVNTLTAPDSTNASVVDLAGFNYTAGDPYAGSCWDLVFTGDDPASRPDPFLGELLPGGSYFALIPLSRETFGGTATSNDVRLIPLASRGFPATPAAQPSPPLNYYYALGNAAPNPIYEAGTPSQTNGWPTTITGQQSPSPSLIQTMTAPFDPMNGSPSAPTPFIVRLGILPGLAGSAGVSMSLPPNYSAKIPALGPQQVRYYWVCLRRPANLFAPVSATNPMRVVDAARFPYIEGTGPIDGSLKSPSGVPVPNTDHANTIYSIQRFQPYRGGHAVPYFAPPANAGASPNPPLPNPAPPLDTHYGYTEQIVQPGTSSYSQFMGTRGIYYVDTKGKIPVNYYATMGFPRNQDPTAAGQILGAYHTLGWANDQTESWDYVPFHDRDFSSVAELTLVPGCAPGLFTKQFAELPPSGSSMLNNFVNSTPQPTTGGYVFSYRPTGGGSNVPTPPLYSSSPLPTVKTFPYLIDKFFYTSASPAFNGGAVNWDPVLGPSSGGWFRMFEFYEVPGPGFGSVGGVALGDNFDWARRDARPGLLNPNLVVDEEAYLGLMGNAGNVMPRPSTVGTAGVTYSLQQLVVPPPFLNAVQVGQDNTAVNSGSGFTPAVVTLWDPIMSAPVFLRATPFPQMAAYPVPSIGFFDSTFPSSSGEPGNNMKASFSDFLKVRHGGSGYLFGPHEGAPFRSLSYPDINFTAFRPALSPAPSGKGIGRGGLSGGDAGVKNQSIATRSGTTIYPPAIPPRRLFQIPDNTSCNASEQGDSFCLGYIPSPNYKLNHGYVDLTSSLAVLGSTPVVVPLQGTKEHPYFRSEWYQKILNLTTVRSHQYAVWITVGFFEVRRRGDPTQARTNPGAAYDILGREVGLPDQPRLRFRAFFVVDRLRLKGFDASATGVFKDAILYRRIISE